MNDIVKILTEYYPDLTDDQKDRLSVISTALQRENQKFNLTALKTDAEIALLHLYDSLSLLKTGLFAGQSVIDIGCGAGFPSLPLAICAEDCGVTANDSTGKKLSFVEQTAAEAGIKNIKTLFGRAEELSHEKNHRESYGIAVSRGVARLNVLAEWCLPFVKQNGYFTAMKGSNAEAELKEAENAITQLGGTLQEVKKVEIPTQNRTHHIIIIRKTTPTPSTYPRQNSNIIKKPL